MTDCKLFATPVLWPKVCTCNSCLHEKVFYSWQGLQAFPICEQCGEHAFEGDGYCWCSMCSRPANGEKI